MAQYYDSGMWSHVPLRWRQVMSRTSSRPHYYHSFTKLQLKCPIARFIQKPFLYILPAWVDIYTCFTTVLEDGICLSTTPQGLTSHNTNFKNKDLTICKFWGFHTAVVLWVWHCNTGWVVLEIMKDLAAFIWNVKNLTSTDAESNPRRPECSSHKLCFPSVL
jgi:hypothetical protein